MDTTEKKIRESFEDWVSKNEGNHSLWDAWKEAAMQGYRQGIDDAACMP